VTAWVPERGNFFLNVFVAVVWNFFLWFVLEFYRHLILKNKTLKNWKKLCIFLRILIVFLKVFLVFIIFHLIKKNIFNNFLFSFIKFY
jgi:hypothetical protein